MNRVRGASQWGGAAMWTLPLGPSVESSLRGNEALHWVRRTHKHAEGRGRDGRMGGGRRGSGRRRSERGDRYFKTRTQHDRMDGKSERAIQREKEREREREREKKT
eukprot:7796860-Pyramimonas_sp.AAC.1